MPVLLTDHLSLDLCLSHLLPALMMSVKHRPECCEYILPMLKNIFKFLSIIPIQVTYPQAEGHKHPLKEIWLYTSVLTSWPPAPALPPTLAVLKGGLILPQPHCLTL